MPRFRALLAAIALAAGMTAVSVATAPLAAAAAPSNQFAWPATGHTDTNDIAWRQANESGSRAVDIQAPLGTVVGAAQSGVVSANWNQCADSNSRGCGGTTGNGFGNYVVVRHDRAGVSKPLYTSMPTWRPARS